MIDYEKELNPEQLDVVLHANGPSLVLAGAGSGKTRTITYRLAHLIEAGVSPEHILLLTFTNKASQEMIKRVELLLEEYPQGLWAGTFHSIANRLLRQYASCLGFTTNFTILDQEDSKALIKMSIKDLSVETKDRRFPSAAVLQSIFSFTKNADRSFYEVLEEKHASFLCHEQALQEVFALYKKRKQAADAMDFDDLLVFLRDLLMQKEQIKQKLSKQFEEIMVDEYQDTNGIQAQIVQELSSVHHNLLVVGDDAQSIYSFRAAEIRNILDFPKKFPQAHLFHLTKNYRSSPEILELANQVIEQNVEQYKKQLSAVCSSVGKPILIAASSAKQEAIFVTEQIRDFQKQGKSLSHIAVLFRAAFHSQVLELELIKRNIPYEYRGGMKFFERAHIKDALAYLRLFLNGKDEMAWMRALSHQPGLGLITSQKIFNLFSGGNLQDCLQADAEHLLPSRAQFGWRGFTSLIKGLLSSSQRPADFLRALASSSYRDYVESTYPDMHDRLDDLEQFAMFAEGYEDIKSFLDDVSLKNEYGSFQEISQPKEQIILSTIHQAKGLEWENVFLIHLSQGSFPHVRSFQEKGGLEEERRLFYVAATRAKKNLFLTYPSTIFSSEEIQGPSLFLQELPQRLFEKREFDSSRSFMSSSFEEEPTVVFDEYGEIVPNQRKSKSFLRSVDDLL